MNIEQEREMFEKKFPKPRHCVWTGNGYAVTKYGAWEASAYVDKFEGWRTRAAQQSQDREDAERWRYATDWSNKDFAICKRVGDYGVCWEPIKTNGPIDHARHTKE